MLNHFSFLQDLDPDAQFISESPSFDVVPGKLGKFSAGGGWSAVIDLVPNMTLPWCQLCWPTIVLIERTAF